MSIIKWCLHILILANQSSLPQREVLVGPAAIVGPVYVYPDTRQNREEEGVEPDGLVRKLMRGPVMCKMTCYMKFLKKYNFLLHNY